MMDSNSRSKQAPIFLLMNGPGLIIYSAAGYATRNWRYASYFIDHTAACCQQENVTIG